MVNAVKSGGLKFGRTNSSSANISTLLGKQVTAVRWNLDRQKTIERKTGCRSIDSVCHYACVDLVCENDEVYQMNAWCDHNGYYPHDVHTKWKDHDDTQSL